MKWVRDFEYRKSLNIPSDITYGIEIEFSNANRLVIANRLLELFNEGKLIKPWNVKEDKSLYSDFTNFSYETGEATSDILTDKEVCWDEIELVCDEIIKNGGMVNSKCAGHIHIGANILEDNLKYYIRFAKLWTIYEDIILRFSAGSSEKVRDGVFKYAKSNVPVFKHIGLFEDGLRDFEKFKYAYSTSKHLAVSLRNLDPKRPIKTIEVRCPNGTLDHGIWQNNINFFIKFLLACKDDLKDWERINAEFIIEKDLESDVIFDYEKAKKLSDFIFSDEVDKENFLKQYIKIDKKK